MKALILNSGLGSRMGDITRTHPKCMTDIPNNETIISRQLRLLAGTDIKDVIITTGYFNKVLVDYCESLNLPLNYTFVHNPDYSTTNYIYSIYLAKELLEDDDILLIHGDLVFLDSVLKDIIACKDSCVKVSSTLPLPPKDFKAVIKDGYVKAVGVEFFDSAMEAQALYKINKDDWKIWMNKMIEFCETDQKKVYAEKALNAITDELLLKPFDVEDRLCSEIDNSEDLEVVSAKLIEQENLC